MNNGPPPLGWTPNPAQSYAQQLASVAQIIIRTPAPPVGPGPTRIICPACRADVSTTVKHEATAKTHIAAMLLCLFL